MDANLLNFTCLTIKFHYCHHANVGFASKSKLLRHVETHHENKKRIYTCEENFQTFKHIVQLHEVNKIHSSSNINPAPLIYTKCSYCEFAFSEKNKLEEHILQAHETEEIDINSEKNHSKIDNEIKVNFSTVIKVEVNIKSAPSSTNFVDEKIINKFYE